MLIAAAMAIALTQATAPKHEHSCKTEYARYTMMREPGFTAGFKRLPSNAEWINNVAFYLHSRQSKHTYWFLFDRGSSPYINMISLPNPTKKPWKTPDPDGPRVMEEMHYIPADRSLRFSIEIPTAEKAAPYYILLPDLTEVLWYSARPRESGPLAFLKLTHCGRPR
jgi:hypothetical protein